MDKPRATAEHLVELLRQADRDLAQGQSVEDFCRRRQISTNTYYGWRQKYGGLNVPEAKRLKSLETENAKPKKLLTEILLANEALQGTLANEG